MASSSRLLTRMRPRVMAPRAVPRFASVHIDTIQSQTPPTPLEPSKTQSMPIGAFYQAMVDDPLPGPAHKPEEPPSSSIHKRKDAPKQDEQPQRKAPKDATPPSPPASDRPSTVSSSSSSSNLNEKGDSHTITDTQTTDEPLSGEAKAARIFGSGRHSAKAREEQLAAFRSKATLIAGVLVPPKPEEPTDCCMSGCVNCVYERFQEELEEWREAKAKADKKLAEQEASSNPNGIAETLTEAEDPLANIPVGIREFMKFEKSKRQTHEHEHEGLHGG